MMTESEIVILARHTVEERRKAALETEIANECEAIRARERLSVLLEGSEKHEAALRVQHQTEYPPID